MGDITLWLRILLFLTSALAGVYLLGFLWEFGREFADIILLLFLSWLVAFILGPLIEPLARVRRVPRVAAAGVVYLGLSLVVLGGGFLVLPATVEQIVQLSNSLPTFLQPVPELLDAVQAWLDHNGIDARVSDFYQMSAIVARVETLGAGLALNAVGIAQGIASALVNLVLVLVLAFYFLLEGDQMAKRLVAMLPARYRDEGRFFLETIDRTFGGFLRGLVVQAVISAVGTAGIMWLVGLPFVLPISAFSGLVMVVPFVGALLGLLAPLAIALFTGDLVKIVLMLVGLLLLQQLVLNVVGPKVMGASVGLHPMLVLLAILLGIKVAGLWGAFFGVPVAGVVYSMAKFFYERSQGAAHDPG